jgi:hypothetical protein
MDRHLPWIWGSVIVMAGLGAWRHEVLLQDQARLAGALHEERTSRATADRQLKDVLAEFAKGTQTELSQITKALATISAQVDGVGTQSKRSKAVLDLLYEVRESHGEVIAIAPKGDESALGLRK